MKRHWIIAAILAVLAAGCATKPPTKAQRDKLAEIRAQWDFEHESEQWRIRAGQAPW